MTGNPRSIRSRIIVALVVPSVALSVLWGMAVRDSASSGLTLRDAADTRELVVLPCVRMLAALQAERSSSQEFLATGRRDASELRAQRAVTDAATADFNTLSAQYDAGGEAAGITRARIAAVDNAVSTLPELRTKIDAGSVIRAAVLNSYTELVTNVFGVLSAAAALGAIQVERITQTVVDIARVSELLSQEDAVLTGAGTEGRFATGEYSELLQIVGALRFQIPTAGSALPTDIHAIYEKAVSGPDFSTLRAVEDQIVRGGQPGGIVPISLRSWKAAYEAASQKLDGFVIAGYDEAVAEARRVGGAILLRFAIFGILGLFTLVTSLVLAIRIGRSVVRRLSLLRTAATDLAGRRLPEVMARLDAGEEVDVAAETLRPPPGDDEIGEVGAALAEVQRSAIQSAVGEAALRRGMAQVLVNVARRNQGLIDRQLEAIAQVSALETRPVVLAGQLAVQMRRYAEHLVILAGSARTRGMPQPEPLAQLVATAAGEVQHTERIAIGSIADVDITGPAVADVAHLLAELMDNAVSFSPPDTPVRVSARWAPHGVAVTVEDHGLGMSPTALDETNRRLARPPEFDPATSSRLGLYVVAVLAAQRGIRVYLEPSGAGGITAVVLIPPDLTDSRDAAGRPVPAAVWHDDAEPTSSRSSARTLSAALAGMHRRTAEK